MIFNILYIYIAPYLKSINLSNIIQVVLLIFGVASVLGIWIVGILIDRWLRTLIVISLAGFALASILIGIGNQIPFSIYIGVGLWGLTIGGAATLLQTAAAEAAGESADVAQAMLVTTWNAAIGGGGVIGGILLNSLGIRTLPWSVLILIILSIIIVSIANPKKNAVKVKRMRDSIN
ncbi:MFS transporter [Priestia endophytica]|uniref:MFS transporter n=1 Tax=Priestia endophytica TaxID=135735 RepID=UPI001F5BC33D|nr:MFS transporter [Priestia endophytica]